MGIRHWGVEHQVSLYADDLLYVTDPVISIPEILDILGKFGAFSGYKLNFTKSQCFPLNNLALTITQGELPFRLSKTSFKYLGIKITRSIKSPRKENFAALVEKVRSDLQRWKVIRLSLAGRVQCIKMNILPQFFYLFMCLPLFLPKSFFQSVDSLISCFIWRSRVPCINKFLLQRSRPKGGLALPNFMFYYWEANIQKIILLLQHPDINWCRMEADSCSSSLRALVCAPLPERTYLLVIQ